MNFHDFHFLRPWWLLAFPAGFLLLRRLGQQETKNPWAKICDPHLLEHLLVGEPATAGFRKTHRLLLAMLLLATLALAGPAWERRPQALSKPAVGRVLVFDLSLSMRSTDLPPDRLRRARSRAHELIKAGVGFEQGLVVFAGDSFVVTPLTDDRATVINLLAGLTTDIMPVQGSRADRGLEMAAELLRRAAIDRGQIILFADDADASTVAMAVKLRHAGCRVDVIAVGTETGAPVPLPAGGYLKDGQGNIVVPVPNFTLLRQVAVKGGGRYCKVTAPAAVFTQFYQPAGFSPKGQQSIYRGDQWLDRGPWLLIPLLLLAAFSCRRGWLFLLVALWLCNPEPAAAFSWRDLWQRPDQQAAAAFARRDYPAAARLAAAPAWKAAALYRAGKFREAAAVLEPFTSASACYNRGNALARAGEYEKALAAYDQALSRNPGMANARFNRELVAKLLRRRKQEQPGSSSPGDGRLPGKGRQTENRRPAAPGQHGKKGEQGTAGRRGRESKTSRQPEKEPGAVAGAGPREGETARRPASASGKDSVAGVGEKAVGQKELEQWLRRVPDDPGGLLKRKFFSQYHARRQKSKGRRGW
ncbi:MAG: VWA domain-containing protein [Deltaproteobacteria bacterium]|nr:VWA domain-containing protein [Deltaproteobacteria bacterium]